jgi:hypothetical protein
MKRVAPAKPPVAVPFVVVPVDVHVVLIVPKVESGDFVYDAVHATTP